MQNQSHNPISLVRFFRIRAVTSQFRFQSSPPACPPPHQCRPSLTAVPSRHLHRALPVRQTVLLASICLAMSMSAIPAAQQNTQSSTQKPSDSSSAHDHAAMNARGEAGMGFSQTATTHHFLLKSNGGVIQVEANDPKDAATRESIRTHLTHITHAFSQGDFDIPMFVHDTTPPGAPDMKRLKDKIAYTYKETPAGARVLITTSDPEALAAIHKYLRFQIQDHQTHDPTTVQ